MITKENISAWFQNLQTDICNALEQADGVGKFSRETWERPGGGGGLTRAFAGAIIEKGGVNFSAVHGKMPEATSKILKVPHADNFFATGVSIVLHPSNPFVPIIHMNVRYFELSNGINWFGGGIDLTPHYIDTADAKYFHSKLKEVCDQHHTTYYPEFKKWADDYFYISHRSETRGVGGIFFDRLKADEQFTKQARWDFVKSVGEAFAPIYTYYMNKNNAIPFTEQNKYWQYLRRGRYAEFNLVWDAGTKFGLETDGRTESILMSLPPMACWEYNNQPETDSAEANTLSLLKKDIDWLNS